MKKKIRAPSVGFTKKTELVLCKLLLKRHGGENPLLLHRAVWQVVKVSSYQTARSHNLSDHNVLRFQYRAKHVFLISRPKSISESSI